MIILNNDILNNQCMEKTSTQHDLIRYAYNETNMKDADRIQRAIDGDPLLQEDFNEINDVLNTLDKGKVQPSDETVKKILDFARNSN